MYVFALLIVILLVRPSGLLGFAGAGESVTATQSQNCVGTTRIGGRRQRSSGAIGYDRSAASGRSCWALRWRPLMHFTLPKAVGPYYTRIVMDIGIAMILAVSLNIVNGMTGQFSLGHAAFMALGGYAAGMRHVLRLDADVGHGRQARRVSGRGRMAVCRRLRRWRVCRDGRRIRRRPAVAATARRLPGDRHAWASAKSCASSCSRRTR